MIHVETSVKVERRASWGLGAPPPDIRLSFNICRLQHWIMCTKVQFWCTHLPAHSTRHSSLVQHSPTAAARFICECSSSQHCLVLCSVQLMHSDELIRIFVPVIVVGKKSLSILLKKYSNPHRTHLSALVWCYSALKLCCSLQKLKELSFSSLAYCRQVSKITSLLGGIWTGPSDYDLN